MRYVIDAGAVVAVLVMTGMMTGAASAASVQGAFADNGTALCNYTISPGGTTTVNSQAQALSATFFFDGAGSLTIEFVNNVSNAFVNNVSNVPTWTRSTTTGTCAGVYLVDADNFVTTEVACVSATIDGAGLGNTTQVPSITGRFLKVGDELFRMPAGPPAEETVITTLPGGGTTTTYRKCSRVGALRKGVH